MRRRIAAVTCCLSLVHVSIAAADDTTSSRSGPLTLAVVNAAPQSGPIRNSSSTSEIVTRYLGEPSAAASLQERDAEAGSWLERHPVWTGAIVGFSAGFLLTYAATHDSDKGELLKVMSPGAGAMFWGGVTAGVGALAGWAIGRNRDDE